MRLTILGGGGFRVPLVVDAVSRARDRVDIDEIVLHDVDAERLAVIRAVVAEQVAGRAGGSDAPRVRVERDLRAAVADAAIVFSAIRVGGTRGRVDDERVARDLGLLGQETVGPGGLAYAMRTVPVVDAIASVVAQAAPQAWVVNFTNPAGLVTEAMRARLGDRVVGICDTPIGLVRSAARAAGLPERGATGDYLGLNHLGWLRSLVHDGTDHLPALLASDEALLRLDEAALYDVAWLRAIGCLPGEYLHYYEREAPDGPAGSHEGGDGPAGHDEGRAAYLARQQGEFFAAGPGVGAARRWRAALAERENTYMADARTREHTDLGRDEKGDRQGGGYHEVAVDLMAALLGGDPAWMILNLANDGVVPALPDDAVIEVSARVDAGGARPAGPHAELSLAQLGLVAGVKACERLAIEAARTGSRELAWRAFAEHPLVSSPELGRRLLDGYLAAEPRLREVLTAP
ncbi:6-phospho-beta-glucosidase [Salana multivorans]|uniref:6-phospho-beta-glucosidase n=1 Tax=Salana multivorans TaxID=120377 RepID=A0A3N2D2E6_9MICO|nr:6-phospho-beta-glucosidase [Salana multivorans]ROR93946.1 6-phospho-beta-glucosidase [Salana multivorans]